MARYKYEVTGSLLSGNVSVSGAKNAVLPILAATLINKGVSHINNVPYLSDIDVAIDILRAFNCYVERSGSMLTIDASNAKYSQVPELLTSRCRASLAFVGSSIGRFGEADIALPGGCVLGPRPVDMHIDVMKALGLNINDADTIHVWGKVHDNEVLLPYPSVGVTENVLMMAATLLKTPQENLRLLICANI